MGGKGVGGGCHGDSNTPVALPTCLPGPNLLGEGGEEGMEGGEAEGAETVIEGGGSEGEETEEEGGKKDEWGSKKWSEQGNCCLCCTHMLCPAFAAHIDINSTPHLSAR